MRITDPDRARALTDELGRLLFGADEHPRNIYAVLKDLHEMGAQPYPTLAEWRAFNREGPSLLEQERRQLVDQGRASATPADEQRHRDAAAATAKVKAQADERAERWKQEAEEAARFNKPLRPPAPIAGR